MNETHLRAAFPVPHEPMSLDAKIDRALAEDTRTRRVQRRWVLGGVLTSAVAVAFVALPASPASASLGRILGALEASDHVRITQYAVDAEGNRVLTQTTDVAGGDRHTFGQRGSLDRFEIGTKRLTLDPLLGAYVVAPRDKDAQTRLKIRLAPGKGVYAGMQTEVVRARRDGMEILRATETDPDAKFRFVFEASPKSYLPIVARREIRMGDGWRTVETTEFNYAAPFRIALPAAPRIDEAKTDALYRRDLSSRSLGEVPLDHGRIVVRRLDVAQDGAVFVAFQRGEAQDEGFAGYTFRLTDDLGTAYLRVGKTYSRSFGKASSPDGPYRMEVFLPLKPLSGWKPRTLRLQAHRFANGAWAGTLERTRFDGQERPTSWPGVLSVRSENLDPTPVDLPARTFAEPTCGSAPNWAALFSPDGFGDPFLASVSKTEGRARRALDERR